MDTKSSEAQYMSGFGNEFQTEAISGALPKGQNNPQRCPMDLFAEQLSGSAFTRDRAHNLRSWLYRIRPSVVHGEFEAEDLSTPPLEPLISTFTSLRGDPNQLRWDPLPLPSVEEEIDFVDGLVTVAGSGAASEKSGVAIHLFTANISMRNKAFVNSDGYLLLVLQQGNLSIQTELGYLELSPKEICVIPRGIVFRVELSTECPARGYILETFSGPFELPNLGPLGANGLANPRDFLVQICSLTLYPKCQCLAPPYSTDLSSNPAISILWQRTTWSVTTSLRLSTNSVAPNGRPSSKGLRGSLSLHHIQPIKLHLV